MACSQATPAPPCAGKSFNVEKPNSIAFITSLADDTPGRKGSPAASTALASADVIPGNRVVFDIKGNTYRLVVRIHYNSGRLFIRFIGTHAEYDRIKAETC